MNQSASPTANLLAEHVRLINKFGVNSLEVRQFVEAHQNNSEFIELAQTASDLKKAFEKK